MTDKPKPKPVWKDGLPLCLGAPDCLHGSTCVPGGPGRRSNPVLGGVCCPAVSELEKDWRRAGMECAGYAERVDELEAERDRLQKEKDHQHDRVLAHWDWCEWKARAEKAEAENAMLRAQSDADADTIRDLRATAARLIEERDILRIALKNLLAAVDDERKQAELYFETFSAEHEADCPGEDDYEYCECGTREYGEAGAATFKAAGEARDILRNQPE